MRRWELSQLIVGVCVRESVCVVAGELSDHLNVPLFPCCVLAGKRAGMRTDGDVLFWQLSP